MVGHHELVRAGLREFIRTRNIEIVSECDTASKALIEVLRLCPDVILMDMFLPDGSGVQACQSIRNLSPNMRVLFWTDFDDDEARNAGALAGAERYLLKDIETDILLGSIENSAFRKDIRSPVIVPPKRKLLDSVQSIGMKALSSQERRILSLVAEGKTNKEIGNVLGLSAKTVKNYLSNVFQKLQVTRRSKAAVLFKQGNSNQGLHDPHFAGKFPPT